MDIADSAELGLDPQLTEVLSGTVSQIRVLTPVRHDLVQDFLALGQMSVPQLSCLG